MIIPIYKKIKSVNARLQTEKEEEVYKYILNHPKCSYREIINETELTEASVSKAISWLKSRKSIRADYLIRGRKNVYTANTKSTLKTKPRLPRVWVRHTKSRLMCEIPNCKNKALMYDRGTDKWLCSKHR
jgi:predicted transcriptional regulator